MESYDDKARLEDAKRIAFLEGKDEANTRYEQNIKDIINAFTSKQSSNPILSFTNTAKAESDMSDNSRNFNIDQRYAMNANAPVATGDNATQNIENNNVTPEPTQNLPEAAAEIQQLLQQLEKTNPTATEAQQEAFVSAAITPTKKERLINALKEGGQGAIEHFLDNPYLNVAIRIIEGWRNP